MWRSQTRLDSAEDIFPVHNQSHCQPDEWFNLCIQDKQPHPSTPFRQHALLLLGKRRRSQTAASTVTSPPLPNSRLLVIHTTFTTMSHATTLRSTTYRRQTARRHLTAACRRTRLFCGESIGLLCGRGVWLCYRGTGLCCRGIGLCSSCSCYHRMMHNFDNVPASWHLNMFFHASPRPPSSISHPAPLLLANPSTIFFRTSKN